MKTREVSFYKNGIPLKHGRKFIALAMDFLWTLILTVLLFAAAVGILSNTKGYKNHIEDINSSRSSLYTYVLEASLDKGDTNGTLLGSEAISRMQIKNLVCTSLIKAGKGDTLSKNIYNGAEELKKDNDLLYKYQLTFKNQNLQYYSGSIKSYSSDAEYFSYVMTDEIKKHFNSGVTFPFLLKEDSAIKVDAYYLDSSYEPGKKIYNELYTNYLNLFNEARNEFTARYKPYVNEINVYENAVHKTYFYSFSGGIIAFVLSFLILEVLIPLLNKNGKTLSMIMMKNMGYTDIKGNVPSKIRILIKGLLEGISCFLAFPLALIFFYSSNGVELLFETYGGFSPFYFGIFSLVFMILSFVYSYFGKRNQTLGEAVSGLILRDAREFNITKAKESRNGEGK